MATFNDCQRWFDVVDHGIYQGPGVVLLAAHQERPTGAPSPSGAQGWRAHRSHPGPCRAGTGVDGLEEALTVQRFALYLIGTLSMSAPVQSCVGPGVKLEWQYEHSTLKLLRGTERR